MYELSVLVLIILNCALPTWQIDSSENGTFLEDILFVAQSSKVLKIFVPDGDQVNETISNVSSVIAIEHDSRNDCLFWADSMQNKILQKCWQKQQDAYKIETLVEVNIGNVEGLSYDWISELLYFVDASRSKIEVIKPTDKTTVNRLRRTIIKTGTILRPSKLRGIVVYPQKGYLYWTDWADLNPSVSRSNLDGSNSRELIQKPHVVWPNGITIDYKYDHVYWTEARLGYIGRCDLDGGKLTVVVRINKAINQAYAIALYENIIYWNDLKTRNIFKVDRETGMGLGTLAVNVTGMLDMKVFKEISQTGTNACSGNYNCSHICVGAPDGEFSCLCPEGMSSVRLNGSESCWCPGLRPPYANGTCPRINGHCPDEYFQCSNKLCITDISVCDGHDDCFDGSDELNCHTCGNNAFRCKSDGKCILKSDKCDGTPDCDDGSDEEDCPSINCKDTEFRCSDHECILKRWVCDGDKDCKDGSDELNCTKTTSWLTCDSHSFSCGDGICIHSSWLCDGDRDCPNGLDEIGCSYSTPPPTFVTTTPTPTGQVELSNSMITNVTFDRTQNLLRWTVSDDASAMIPGLNFSVDYGTDILSMRPPKFVTQELEAELEDLQPCEKYVALVTVTQARLSDLYVKKPHVLHFHTPFNSESSPELRNLETNSVDQTMKIHWEHSCQIEGEHPSSYDMSVTDVFLNKTTNYTIPQGPTDPAWYRINIEWGALYKVEIGVPERKSSARFLKIIPLRLPTPSQLTIDKERNGTYRVAWNKVEWDENTAFEYEVLVAKGLSLNDTSPIAFKITTKQPPVFIDPSDLAQSLATATNFTVGVRIRTSLGYPSAINRFEHIEVQPLLPQTNETPTGISKWIIVCGALVILAQLALITHFVLAHRPSTKHPEGVTPMATWRIRDRLYNDGVNGSQPTTANKSLPIIEEAGDYVDDDEDESTQLVLN